MAAKLYTQHHLKEITSCMNRKSVIPIFLERTNQSFTTLSLLKMPFSKKWILAVISLAFTTTAFGAPDCKCRPNDGCWPSHYIWQALNTSISGKLIKPVPAAINLTACSVVVSKLSNEELVRDDPIALDSPSSTDYGCPPIDFSAGGLITGNCTMGDAPRQGIAFKQRYTSSNNCQKPVWDGSAFKIAGGYIWEEVYAEAEKENVIVVGGSDPTVGAIGGWAQGGGHSPASRDYGLGVQQILEAEVVLTNGSLITASACENQDLFAIRGGGGGTYGLVVSTTVKAYPMKHIVAQVLNVSPLTDTYIPVFMDALTLIYSEYPDLNDAGFSGYGTWGVQSPLIAIGNSTTGYNHRLGAFGRSIGDAKMSFEPLMLKLAQFNASLSVSATYTSFPTYADYYSALAVSRYGAGDAYVLGSRLFDRKALTASTRDLKEMLNVVAGSSGQLTRTTVCLVSGGQVFVSDHTAGFNPAWRSSYVHQMVRRGWSAGTDAAVAQEINDEMLYAKAGAMKKLAPDTGCYMNECDARDPDYLKDFYGQSLSRLEEVKRAYDPHDVFYCPTCVGSNRWKLEANGTLCRNV
ncbi:isoamyl alcohol oxidase protein [Rutstroemia sp. NJR-2017a WRK4]|nr:isoamyl alcohol oxidase protein [Rutstroemia sp. NJR-2017a WRK4]PQE14762.1 isoamyl alcohol oxidase protein [Rutstroemia sp. NJR-2017a WRK4]